MEECNKIIFRYNILWCKRGTLVGVILWGHQPDVTEKELETYPYEHPVTVNLLFQ